MNLPPRWQWKLNLLRQTEYQKHVWLDREFKKILPPDIYQMAHSPLATEMDAAGGDLDRAFAAYQDRRSLRTARVQLQSRLIGEGGHKVEVMHRGFLQADIGQAGGPEAAYRELLEVIAEFSSNYSSHLDKLLDRLPRERCYPDVNPAI